MSKNAKKGPSVLNWMVTLILCGIPGVNILFLILSAIFAKSAAKRHFAVAHLLLAILSLIALFVVFAFFPEYVTRLSDMIRSASESFPLRTV